MESMDTVSLQAVTLADGSTAYIQHDSKTSFSDGQIMDGQVIQLEDGSAAYVQHVSMPKAGTSQILSQYRHKTPKWPPHVVRSLPPLPSKLFGRCVVIASDMTAYVEICSQKTLASAHTLFVLCALGGDSLQLEDGQAVQLEDGTTAYIHTPKGEK